MAEFRTLRPMALSDEEQYDWLKARSGTGNDEPPEYSPGLSFTIRETDFDALGVEECRPGETVRFAAFLRACSVNQRTDGCRIEAEIDMLALGDGKMVELDDTMRPTLCLDHNDHERLDLDAGCQRGDMLHLIGMARVEAVDDNQYIGRSVCLQITDATVEDEDDEARAS